MKDVLIKCGVALGVAILAIIIAVMALNMPAPVETPAPTPEVTEEPKPSEEIPVVTEIPVVSFNPVSDDPIKTYDNGIATFQYDSTKVGFDEIMSDSTDGVPLTSFLSVTSGEALPRVDVFPLTLDAPFTEKTTEEEWKNLAGALLVSYFKEGLRENVGIKFSDVTVTIDGDHSVMTANFSCVVPNFPDQDMDGSAKLISNDSHALIMISLVEEGGTIPEEMASIVESASLYDFEVRVPDELPEGEPIEE